jgi:outer membrane protein assembly factor BamB
MSVYRSPSTPLVVVAVNGSAYGLDAATGAIVWSNTLDGGGFGAVEIAIENDAVLACAMGGFLFCLDYATGELRWKTATTGLHGRATMLVDGGRIIVAKGGAVDCYTLATGERLWHAQNVGTGSAALGVPGRVRQADAGG